jgi:hypothetical protein
MSLKIAILVSFLGSVKAGDLKLATFDGVEKTTVSWQDLNDPVMGGASTSTFKVTDAKTGLFNGTVAIVGFLKAPGFAKIVGSKSQFTFADITGYDNIALRVKSSTPDYKGFKVEFAAPGIPKTSTFSGGSYKADFNLTSSTDWQLVEVPLTRFSYDHSDYTGRCDTKDPASLFHPSGQQHYCCDRSGFQPSKSEVCVDAKYLNQIDSLGVWAEGVAGDFNIEIDWIGATKKSVGSSPGSLVTFDGAAGTTFKFTELNDPVMGGKSVGTWSLGNGFGIMDGEVVDVPSLKAPGFIKAAADGSFPDVSAFIDGSLVLTVRTSTPDYKGYRVTFVSGAASPSFSCAGGGSLPFSRGCYKQKFTVPAGSDFVEVKLPFNTFSDKWSSSTGEHTAECATEQDVCPTAAKLSKIQRIELWGEGAAGKLHLEVKSVSAERASGERLVLV